MMRRIAIPLIGANLAAGAILGFAFAMLEVSDSLILAQQAQHYPITKAIYTLLSTLGNGTELAAALGVLLLLWNELTNFAGQPLGVLMVLVAAATWAYGTQRLRHTPMPMPTLTIAFWMTTLTTLLMVVLSVATEQDSWHMPSSSTAWAIAYNAVGVFAFAQAAWLTLARGLPPVASTLSVMFIPVLGVFSGAWLLGEVLHWQDWTAVALMVVAIASVLWPAKSS
jgi:drug/metabolite transporter (DMT)-like permease